MTLDGVLHTIKISHYCDKARWALEKSSLSFYENAAIPVLHIKFMKNLKGKSSSTPHYITTDGKVLFNSTEILQYLYGKGEKWIYPNDEAKILEKYFTEELGDYTRAFIYYHLLNAKNNTFLKRSFQKDAGKSDVDFVEKKFESIIKVQLIKTFNLNESTPKNCLDKIDIIFKKVEDLLKDGRKYLANTDKISGADITFAALCYPILFPSYMEDLFVDKKDMESITELFEHVQKFRETIPGQFALRLYKERGDKIKIQYQEKIQSKL